MSKLLEPESTITKIIRRYFTNQFSPVRAILFNKNLENNWAVGWHQDRTIAVKNKFICPGFEIWTKKSGILHVEPPFEYLAEMITLRVHLDICDKDNAPLHIIPSSHKMGRLKNDQIIKLVQKTRDYTCLASSGDVWVYSTSIVHSSQKAYKPENRRVLQIDFSNKLLPFGLEWFGV